MGTLKAYTITVIDDLVCEPVNKDLIMFGVIIHKNNECIVDYVDDTGNIIIRKSSIFDVMAHLGISLLGVSDDIKNTNWQTDELQTVIENMKRVNGWD